MKTLSEVLFEQLCRASRLQCVRVERRQGEKTPDYEVHTADGKVIAEVKQFEPNEEEKRLYQQLQDRGYTDVYGGEPGAKVRLKIQPAAKQLKAQSSGQFPTLLVLYNNVPLGPRGVDPYEIKTAMYGIEKIVLSPDPAGNDLNVVDREFGPKRKVTPTCNTSLSAIGTLLRNSESEPLMAVYHNIYAAMPLPPGWLPEPRFVHYTLGRKNPGEFQEWTEVDSKRGA